MDRLTQHSTKIMFTDSDVMVEGMRLGPAAFESPGYYQHYVKIINKLAAYEDTGYSPLEIKSLECEWNAMRKVVDSYRSAEEQGLLMRLPCKVGMPVYFIKKTGFHPELIETRIDEIGVRHGGMFVKLSCNSMYRTAISAWGKTVFLTRAEAEAALKGESEDV